MKWFRFYHDAYRDPKVQDMKPELFKFWVNTLCVASESDPRGTIRSQDHLRRALGVTKTVAERYVGALLALSLLHRGEDGALTPHNWERRQPESDDAAKRKRLQRDNDLQKQQSGNVTGQVTGHVPPMSQNVPPRGREIENEIKKKTSYPLPPSSNGPLDEAEVRRLQERAEIAARIAEARGKRS